MRDETALALRPRLPRRVSVREGLRMGPAFFNYVVGKGGGLAGTKPSLLSPWRDAGFSLASKVGTPN